MQNLGLFVCGFGGGLIRGLVVYIKYRNSYRNVPFRPLFFSLSVTLSAAVGFLSAWVAKDLGLNFIGITKFTPAIAFVIGFAGGDFIENLYRTISKQTVLIPKV